MIEGAIDHAGLGDERHNIEETVLLPRIEQRQDVRVVELGGDGDFPEETLWVDRGGEFRPEDIHGHFAVVLEILC